MISLVYERNGRTFDWFSCTTRKQLERMLRALRSYGAPITIIHIRVH